MDLQRYQIDQDNQTKIAVAQINAYRGTEELDQDQNGIPDPIEIGNIQECSFSIIKDILELLFTSLFPSTLSCIKKHIKHSSLTLVVNPE
jgi:hypothetical protein